MTKVAQVAMLCASSALGTAARQRTRRRWRRCVPCSPSRRSGFDRTRQSDLWSELPVLPRRGCERRRWGGTEPDPLPVGSGRQGWRKHDGPDPQWTRRHAHIPVDRSTDRRRRRIHPQFPRREPGKRIGSAQHPGGQGFGQTYFNAKCTSCHSISGDLKGIGSKFADPKQLQNAIVGRSSGRGGPPGGSPTTARPITVTVTLSNGTKVEGPLVRIDGFSVTLKNPDVSIGHSHVYLPTNDTFAMYYLTETDPRGSMGLGGKEEAGVGTLGSFLRAIDDKTGKIAWEHKYDGGSAGPAGNGILTTAGKLLFASEGGGNLIAFDPENGNILWHSRLGNVTNGAETYSIDGRRHNVCVRAL